MDKQTKKKIEQFVKDFIEKTTFNISFEVKENRDGNVLVDLITDEPQVLIGEAGQTLWEIQMLFSRVFKKTLGEDVRFDLDINQYKQNRARWLKELAEETANRVALFKKEEHLLPMTAYERRIIHMELAIRTDVVTESVGENEERRVVVKPVR